MGIAVCNAKPYNVVFQIYTMMKSLWMNDEDFEPLVIFIDVDLVRNEMH